MFLLVDLKILYDLDYDLGATLVINTRVNITIGTLIRKLMDDFEAVL